jgi:hypothetical protein
MRSMTPRLPKSGRRVACGVLPYTHLLFRKAAITEPIMTDHSNDSSAKAWSGRFQRTGGRTGQALHRLGAFDKRLAAARHPRLAGPRPHAGPQGIIGADDLADIERGMAADQAARSRRGEFQWSLDDEDVHLNIEKRLTALVGDAGKRLHTGRSRNDQVATDIRLWLREEIDGLGAAPPTRPPCSTWPRSTPTRRCPASRTCRWRSRSPSATT